jgi:hypothetical protein
MCALALATDALDGRLARAGSPTRLGRDLEGLADATFAIAALRGARRRGWLGRGAAGSELARIVIGLGYTVVVWVGSTHAPDEQMLRAARVTTPLRAAGLVAAGCRRRRLAGALVAGGALWSAGATVAAGLRRG